MTDVVDNSTGAPDNTTDWRSSVPEDVRFKVDGDKKIDRLEKFKTPTDVTKSYFELEKAMGSRIAIPKDGDEKGWNEIYGKLGRPETPDKYEFKYEGDVQPDELLESFKKVGHSIGLSQKQFENVVKFQLDAASEQVKAVKQLYEQEDTKLKSEWKGPDYEKNSGIANQVAEKIGLKALFEDLGVIDNPIIKREMFKLNTKLSEDTIAQNKGDSGATKEQRLKEITDSKAFGDAFHPDHNKVMKEFMELHGIKNG